jgi:two-component system OmpR family sensor kinase
LLKGPSSSTIVAALPMKPVSDTLHRLLLIEVGVGLAALVLVGVTGSLLVRFSLRPLERIAASARGIVAADLSSAESTVQLRVPDAPPTTEVGQLSSALNAMLQHIEAAFDARTEAEQKLRQFVADASHELRTPLSSIRGYAELFRRGAGAHPDDLAMAMRRIEEEGQQMSALVDDLLLLARLDQGRPLEREPVDIAAICADAATDSRVVDSRWPVVLDVPPDPLLVIGDQLRLRQVLANLVRNARVHTPPGTTITITATHQDESTAAITVADNGPGIPPEALPYVFDRFFRADMSRSRVSGGSGLGLSIVQAIVRSHGGDVLVSSVPGRTSVEVRLPTTEVAPSQPVHSGSSATLQHPGER